jgi:phage/conjugal plasmid C-4 type zinc finger TraR family protein
MDDGDRGQHITEKLRAWALSRQLQRGRQSDGSFRQCVDCGEAIDEARRKAQSGCRRCVECQTFHEMKKQG